MAKDQRLRVVWMFLFGSMTFLFFALPALSSSCKNTGASCAGTVDYGLNYTLPTPQRCKVIRHPDGSMIQTIPKLFSFPSVMEQIPGLAGRQIICRLPDCVRNLCKNGWCEETVDGYKCHCSTGFQGEHCDERSTDSATTEATTKPKTKPTTMKSVQSDTTTSQDPTTSSESSELSITEAMTKQKVKPATTKSKQPETTSQGTTNMSKSTESLISEATTKLKASPATTISEIPETTTSQKTTTISESTESLTTEATTKFRASPATTISDQLQTTTSKVSGSTESSIMEATTKSTTTSTATLSEQSSETPSQETATMSACSSPVEVQNGGSCYYFSTFGVSHASALSYCSEHNSHLVYIETEEEQDFIEDQIKAMGSSVDYWVGLTGQSRADARWLDGSQLTYDKSLSYSFSGGGGCFVIRSGDFTWHDRLCFKTYGYICEREIDDNV